MKGYTIDCDYLIKVNDCMNILPYPRKKDTVKIGDEVLPIVRMDSLEEAII